MWNNPLLKVALFYPVSYAYQFLTVSPYCMQSLLSNIICKHRQTNIKQIYRNKIFTYNAYKLNSNTKCDDLHYFIHKVKLTQTFRDFYRAICLMKSLVQYLP